MLCNRPSIFYMLVNFYFQSIKSLIVKMLYNTDLIVTNWKESTYHDRVFASLPPVGSIISDLSILLHLSGSSSSPPRESTTRISGQNCPGIGGVYLQKKIRQITKSTAKRTDRMEEATEENRDRTSCENTARKRMTSPFRRFRERTLSRERLANSKKEDADHNQARESCEKVKDVGSNIKDEKGTDIFKPNSRGNTLNCFYSRFKCKRRKTL